MRGKTENAIHSIARRLCDATLKHAQQTENNQVINKGKKDVVTGLPAPAMMGKGTGSNIPFTYRQTLSEVKILWRKLVKQGIQPVPDKFVRKQDGQMGYLS